MIERLLSQNHALTEELLAAATFFNDLDQTRLQLFNGWNVVRQDTHLARFRRDVDLNTEGWCQP